MLSAGFTGRGTSGSKKEPVYECPLCWHKRRNTHYIFKGHLKIVYCNAQWAESFMIVGQRPVRDQFPRANLQSSIFQKVAFPVKMFRIWRMWLEEQTVLCKAGGDASEEWSPHSFILIFFYAHSSQCHCFSFLGPAFDRRCSCCD